MIGDSAKRHGKQCLLKKKTGLLVKLGEKENWTPRQARRKKRRVGGAGRNGGIKQGWGNMCENLLQKKRAQKNPLEFPFFRG
jgi:hypothetical protein